ERDRGQPPALASGFRVPRPSFSHPPEPPQACSGLLQPGSHFREHRGEPRLHPGGPFPAVGTLPGCTTPPARADRASRPISSRPERRDDQPPRTRTASSLVPCKLWPDERNRRRRWVQVPSMQLVTESRRRTALGPLRTGRGRNAETSLRDRTEVHGRIL